jgi:hypothetical protein
MSSESVCQIARSWVDVGSFHTRLFGVVYFAIVSVREFLDTPSYFSEGPAGEAGNPQAMQCSFVYREAFCSTKSFTCFLLGRFT